MAAPRITARLETNDAGEPRFIEGRTKRHFRVKLAVENLPPGTASVLVELDPSFHDPVREIVVDKGAVTADLAITSFGDFPVTVRLPGRREPLVRTWLGRALELNHGSEGELLTSSVATAIAAIRNN